MTSSHRATIAFAGGGRAARARLIRLGLACALPDVEHRAIDLDERERAASSAH